jgi:hypothetical protein
MTNDNQEKASSLLAEGLSPDPEACQVFCPFSIHLFRLTAPHINITTSFMLPHHFPVVSSGFKPHWLPA